MPSNSTPFIYPAGFSSSGRTDAPWYQRVTIEEIERVRKINYNECWRMYLGKHWLYSQEPEEVQLTANYCRKFIDKKIAFLFGRGFDITPPLGAEALQPFITHMWDMNNKEIFGVGFGQLGMICGDAVAKVSFNYEYQIPEFIPVDPGGFNPIWKPGSTTVFQQVNLDTWIWSDTDFSGQRHGVLHREVFTPTSIEEYYGEDPVEDGWRPNLLGEIPVVHVKNNATATMYYGESDLLDMIQPNKKFNETITQIGDVVAYHGSPITILKGLKQSQLIRGSRRMWGGVPKDGDVYNLALQGDLAANNTYMERLKKIMHEMGNVPERSLGEQQAISNTSGVALHMQYLPLVEDILMKRIFYTPALVKLTAIGLRLWALYNQDLANLIAQLIEQGVNPFQFQVKWKSVLPKDRLIELQVQQMMLDMKIQSRRRAAIAMDQPEDELPQIEAEIMADELRQAQMDSLLGASFGNPSMGMEPPGGGAEGMLDQSETAKGQLADESTDADAQDEDIDES